VLVVEVTLLAYAGVYFAANPVLTMPRDWDLFMLPAPALLVYTLVLLPQTPQVPARQCIGPAFALVVLSLPAFVVNARPGATAERLRMVGKHAYHTYYFGSAYIVQKGANLIDRDPDWKLRYRVQTVEDLRPYAAEKDPEFGMLAARAAELFEQRGDDELATRYYRDALSVTPEGSGYDYLRAGFLFKLGHFDEAYGYARAAADSAREDPDTQMLAITCAIRAEDPEGIVTYSRRFLDLVPGHAAVRNVLEKALGELAESESE
jgi:tetratricopeptide (TPR) repeat protein